MEQHSRPWLVVCSHDHLGLICMPGERKAGEHTCTCAAKLLVGAGRPVRSAVVGVVGVGCLQACALQCAQAGGYPALKGSLLKAKTYLFAHNFPVFYQSRTG